MAASGAAGSVSVSAEVPGGSASGGGREDVWTTIERSEEMPAFLMTLVTDSDLWMYLSSLGGLTCGRVSAERALFPYETDDRLHRASEHTGSITLVRVRRGGEAVVWRPLDPRGYGDGVRRSLSRTLLGNRVRFVEEHEGLGLRFESEWSLSDRYGAVRRCRLSSLGGGAVDVELLDGLTNLMPACVDMGLQRSVSTLVDAYKRAELLEGTGVAVYALEAQISDRPEAAESLRANVVWRSGLQGAAVCLEWSAVERFRRGEPVEGDAVSTGSSGCYLCHDRFELGAGEDVSWMFCGDVHLDQGEVVRLRREVEGAPDMGERVEESIETSASRLSRMLALADAEQVTGDGRSCAAHHANVLFNCMRGGLLPGGSKISGEDFRRFVRSWNREVAERHAERLGALREPEALESVRAMAEESGDSDLIRLVLEYLPLTFGRRHGDPSRPWNRFAINLRHPDGSRILYYQGNWRDIFQNWEALCRSYPVYLPHVIAKFVNASTADGYNPYRITRDGIDWERPDPDDPWSNIGYWGDHQIVYLLRLIEQLRDTSPGGLESLLHRELFVYADVPYRIRPYADIVRDSKSTIEFDRGREREVLGRVESVGADGRLVRDGDGGIVRVNLVEKLLVPALAKLSNLVPDGGVWLNTQRPEWNDANNALVGQGLSMVTLYHLRRYAAFCVELLEGDDAGDMRLSGAVAQWCDHILAALIEHIEVFSPGNRPDDAQRRAFMDRVGGAFDAYRERVYAEGPGGAVDYPRRSVTDLFRLARHYCDYGIETNTEADGLAHSYNILVLSGDPPAARVAHLGLMLEGQVALLSSGVLSATRAAGMVEALFESPMFREDLRTFMLYPVVERPGFLERNVVPEEEVASSPLARRLLETGAGGILTRDGDGNVRFSCDFASARDLSGALERLARDASWSEDVHAHGASLLTSYERVFRHLEFTGRSGTMHKYEGIGCVYWHMVSKLLLAVQESFLENAARGDDPAALERLARAYHRVREGIGFNRTAREFGAFSHEPYSHTPLHAGAQQPGMTGQVKEGVIARFNELGVLVRRGGIVIEPRLLRASEFLTSAGVLEVERPGGGVDEVEVPAGGLGFTYCGVPFVMKAGDGARVSMRYRDGREESWDGPAIPPEAAARVFARSNDIESVHVEVDRGSLYGG